ncbi:MAG: DUF3307 domain-containing protein [wastewater metagenome]|nr:DUF3307 domain-containing protein [Candidatus Loosdrechtia aerotolerans]
MPVPFNQSDVTLLLRLIAAHLITDFLLQTKSLVEQRFKKRWASQWLYIHGVFAGILIYTFAGLWNIIWLPFIVFISHVLFDGLKSHGKDTVQDFLLDQFAHVTVILGCWMVLIESDVSTIITFLIFKISKVEFWVLTVSYIVVIWPAGIWIGKITGPWREEIHEPPHGLERAGLWIGRLERILILTFVLIKHYEAIGFLIAAKSVFRFGEIKDPGHRKEAEYILIGTMASFVIAVFLGIFTNWILSYNNTLI